MTRLIAVVNGSYQPQDVALAPQDVALAPQDVALPVAHRCIDTIDLGKKKALAATPPTTNPTVKAVLKRGKQLEDRLIPHLEALALANGQSLDSLRKSKAFGSIPEQVARAIDLGLTPEQTTTLYGWWISKSGKSYGIAANLSYALDDIQIWRSQKCAAVFTRPGEKPPKLILRDADGRTLEEFQDAKMQDKVDRWAQWTPVYPEEPSHA